MKITKQARRDAKQLFRSSMVNGQLDENRVRQIVRHVVSMKPRGYVGILQHLQRLVKLEQDRREARIESATPLSADLQQSVQGNLTRIYGPGLRFTYSQNASLLGGMKVKVGSDVYDGSVQSRLHELQQSF